MTLTLSIPTVGRARSWHLMLLLPVLPWVATLFDAPGGNDVGGAIHGFSLVVICGIAVCLAFSWPRALRGFSPLVRKEVEQLRWPWIVSIFIGQLALLEPKDGDGFAAGWWMVCALLMSAIPFGVEFQHRTLSGLLSQPADRARIWWIKMSILGLALASGGSLLALSWLAAGNGPDLTLARHLALGTFVAWGVTPCLTLLTRGLLPGFVFSVALPAFTLIPLAAFARAMKGTDATFETERLADLVSSGVIWGLFPAYGVLGLILGFRRWRRFESPDGQAEIGTGLFLGTFGAREGERPRWRSPLGPLWIKELRLQTVTFFAAGLLLVVAGAREWIGPGSAQQDPLTYGMFLLAGSVVLLAGATMIAEEHRLGLRDTQLLLPVSRAAQWWIKFCVAAGAASLAIGLALQGLSGHLPRDTGAKPMAFTAWCLLAAFAYACWASSAKGNPLKALIWAIGWTASAAALVQFGYQGLVKATVALDHWYFESMTPGAQEAWMQKAQVIGLPAIEAVRPSDVGRWIPRHTILAILGLLSLAPLSIAVLLAWRNFAHPAHVEHRWWRQNLAVALAMVSAVTAGVATMTWDYHKKVEAETLFAAWHHAQWSKQLRPLDLQLLKLYRANSSWVWNRAVELEVAPTADIGTRHGRRVPHGIRLWIPLPLSATNRDFLLREGRLEPSIREALEREAAAAPTP